MSELHVRKVREVETGGQPTPLEEPYRLVMNTGHTGFISWLGKKELFEPIDIQSGTAIPLNLNFMLDK
jgi:hypothetical protein